MQKKIAACIAALVMVFFAAGCAKKSDVVRVGLVGEEFEAVWKTTAELALKDGIKIQFVNFTDYSLPNRALSDGDIDLNSFQHNAFLQNEISNHGYKIESIGNTTIFFLGVYSHKIQSLDALKDGDTVVVMNDATNEGRALKVLESAGIFTLDAAKGNMVTPKDIIDNPKNIKVVEVDASQTWRSLDDPQVTAAVVNSSFVINAGAVPSKDAIYIKKIDPVSDEPYINIIAARSADKDNPVLKKIVEHFHSPEIRRFITEEKPLADIALPAW